ncbi:MAG: hypothetical protein H7Y20_17625 [Bryobacteraceae bacterium]|nr:hypothetical protein [Bryobacteraceae bacterium]
MRIRYDITVSNGRARVTFDVNPTSGDEGGGEDPRNNSDEGGGEDPRNNSDEGGGTPVKCCDGTVIIGPAVFIGCGNGPSGKLPGRRRPIPPNPIVLTSVSGVGAPRALPVNQGPGKKELASFRMICQEQTEWCWAAVGAAIDNSLAQQSGIKQCEVVQLVTGKQDSCQKPGLRNEKHGLADTLTKLKRLTFAHFEKIAAFELIQSEIEDERPVCARIAWDTAGDLFEDGAHFVVIAGWDTTTGQQRLLIIDPLAGKTSDSVGEVPATGLWIAYEDFKAANGLIGRWVSTYFVKERTGQ